MNDPNEVYYVVLRGAGRQPLFNDDADYRQFTTVVEQATAACGITVHAYCWLRTEARLAMQITDIPISQFAEYVADRYRMERRIEVAGSHFEQQYRGVPVDGQTELPDLVRHIHLAPLKAGLADDIAEYPWSSHHVYVGLESAPWVTTAETLRHFAESGSDPRLGYLEFMKRGVRQLDVHPAPSAGQDTDIPGDRLRKK
jgi:putative transposase